MEPSYLSRALPYFSRSAFAIWPVYRFQSVNNCRARRFAEGKWRYTYFELDETFSVFVLNALVFRRQLFLHATQILPHLGDLSHELLVLW
jgi:hypothetical protein